MGEVWETEEGKRKGGKELGERENSPFTQGKINVDALERKKFNFLIVY